MTSIKKIIFGLIIFFSGTIIVFAESDDLAPNSKSAYLIDFETGEVLYQKNEMEVLAPASMTKIMSMLLIMEAIDNGSLSFDTEVVISEHASSMGGSQVFLETGEIYKVEELLKGIAVASGNDAVVAMSEKIGGTEEKFVEMMNNKARELGLKTTVFKNPHGLDEEGHVSTAHDMAIIAKELLKHPKILEFTSIYEDYLKKPDGTSTWLVNTNKLVRFYEGVDGLKTGFTSTAGYCLTATAKKNNLRVIAVVMGADTSDNRSSDIASMLNYAFNNYKTGIILAKDTLLGEKRIENGEVETVQIVLKNDYTKLLKQNDAIPKYSYNVKVSRLIAPLSRGDVIGSVEVVADNGSVVDTLEVTVKESVNKANLLNLWYRNFLHITAGKILIK